MHLLTPDELATELRLTRRAVYRLAASHQLPHLRVGRRLRFDRDTIEAWLRKMQRAASEEESDGGEEVERQVGRRLRGRGRKASSAGVAGPNERRSAGVRAVTHGEWPDDGKKKLIDIDALFGPEA